MPTFFASLGTKIAGSKGELIIQLLLKKSISEIAASLNISSEEVERLAK